MKYRGQTGQSCPELMDWDEMTSSLCICACAIVSSCTQSCVRKHVSLESERMKRNTCKSVHANSVSICYLVDKKHLNGIVFRCQSVMSEQPTKQITDQDRFCCVCEEQRLVNTVNTG